MLSFSRRLFSHSSPEPFKSFPLFLNPLWRKALEGQPCGRKRDGNAGGFAGAGNRLNVCHLLVAALGVATGGSLSSPTVFFLDSLVRFVY
jgi:hypothetical protein